MDKLPNIIRVRDIPKDHPGLPARATIYKLHSLRKHPRLIYLVPDVGLVFNLGEWESMCAAAQKISEERAAGITDACKTTADLAA